MHFSTFVYCRLVQPYIKEDSYACVMRRDGFHTETMPQGTVYSQFGTFRPPNTFPLSIINLSISDFTLWHLSFFHGYFLKRAHFQSSDDMNNKITEMLEWFSHNDFQRCFQAWQDCMQCFSGLGAQGNFCEEGDWEVLKFWTKYSHDVNLSI
jgi:hypothetical protein